MSESRQLAIATRGFRGGEGEADTTTSYSTTASTSVTTSATTTASTSQTTTASTSATTSLSTTASTSLTTQPLPGGYDLTLVWKPSLSFDIVLREVGMSMNIKEM